MRYLVVIEKGPSSYGAHVPDLPGCVAVGETEDEVLFLIREAVDLHLDSLREHGDPIPPASSRADVIEVGAA
jgi:predicted RNase H-like HicB family nuclease